MRITSNQNMTSTVGKAALRMQAAPAGETVTYNFIETDPLPLPVSNSHLNVAMVFSGLLGAAEDQQKKYQSYQIQGSKLSPDTP